MLIPGLMPLVTYLGPAISGILVGSVATERIFCVPGLGPYLVDAAQNRDYFLIMGIVLLESVFLLSCNLAVDLVCAWLDPRIRMAGRP
jgi:oligopeptide transport system permease protein